MERLNVNLQNRGYVIEFYGNGERPVAILPDFCDHCLVLTDATVQRLYGAAIGRLCADKPYTVFAVEPGEQSKSFSAAESVINTMAAAGLSRKSVLLVLGGGVPGDLGGFCASVYMRGIAFIQVPTTLLAMVDSSVGGKTGINTVCGKNLAGSFHQPQAVHVCPEFLRSLPEREYLAGIGEIMKYGLLDAAFFDFLEGVFDRLLDRDTTVLKETIRECCRMKAGVVAEDEQETGIRKILNIGHTAGHALEAATEYKRWLHGEAVILGMFYETQLGERLGITGSEYAGRIYRLLKRAGVPLMAEAGVLRSCAGYMQHDKKNSGGMIKFILPSAPGCWQEVSLDGNATAEFCETLVESAGRER